MAETYKLKVTQVEQVCLFELTWGKGRQLTAKLPYPTEVELLYQDWQRIYLNYYQSALRGRGIISGEVVAQNDWHGQLVQAEAKLLYEFHQWLRNGLLFDIRQAIGQSVTTDSSKYSFSSIVSSGSKSAPPKTDLLITCDPISLGRLPWEAWEINAEFRNSAPIRISRLPMNIREAGAEPVREGKRTHILVILGDDTGLSFVDELNAISSLKRLAKVTVIGWQPGMDAMSLKQTICDTIQAAPGWDMLFFFGHSNEANAVGGKLAIAPNTTLSVRELEPFLRKAKARGLKFALFNSCKGLDIANSLIDIGLNQVVVMREPVHNRVAQVFFIQFMQSLAGFDDIHTALQKATHSLRSESNLTYPSAHLVPSLFRHSDAVLFQLSPTSWSSKLHRLLPRTRWQTATLALITGLSLLPPETTPLMDGRQWSQSIYRDITQQIPTENSPPTILIQIDEETIRKEPIFDGVLNPMNREYLAKLVDQLSAVDANVIGIDYLLDRPHGGNDKYLSESIKRSVEQGRFLIFSTILDRETKVELEVHKDVASLNWVMQGYANTPRWYLRILRMEYDCPKRCPFAYLLALTKTAQIAEIDNHIALDVQSENNLRNILTETIEESIQDKKEDQNKTHSALRDLYNLRLSFWPEDSRWFHPLLDFSMPPDQMFSSISAYDFLDTSPEDLSHDYDWQHKIVLIASGGYADAEVDGIKDYVEPPPAISYWYNKQDNPNDKFTGGEAVAYGVHHFLNQHYVVPVPDSWLVGLGILAGKGIIFLSYRLQLSRQQKQLSLVCLSLGYGWLSLQLYISMEILLPWLLPVATVWLYALPAPTSSRKSLKS